MNVIVADTFIDLCLSRERGCKYERVYCVILFCKLYPYRSTNGSDFPAFPTIFHHFAAYSHNSNNNDYPRFSSVFRFAATD